MLIKILTVFFCFLELSSTIQLTSLILEYKPRNFKIVNILMIMTNVLPAFFLMDENIILPWPIKTLFGIWYFGGRLAIYFIVFRKINLKLLYVFLFTMNIPQIYMNVYDVIFSNNLIANMLAILTDALLTSFIIIQIKRKRNAKFIHDLINSLPARLYILILVMLYIASIFVMGELKETNRDLYFKIFLVPSMIGLVLSTISIIKISISETEKRSAVELLSKQIEDQVEYYKKINKVYDEFRSFRHDFKNHIICLRALVAANEIDKAVAYMDDIEEMSSVKKKEYNTGNIIIDALLSDKSDKAIKADSKLEFNGYVPTIGITSADLCIVMANAIDNAIEACAKDESSDIKIIKVDSNFKQGYFFFKISNPIFEEVCIDSKNKLVTSKKDNERHGFGVANIIHTVEKYDGNAEISTDNNIFTLDIQMQLKEE